MEIWESFPKCQMLGGRCETLDELRDLEEGHLRVLSETSHSSSATSLLQHLMYFGSKIWILPFGKISGSGNKIFGKGEYFFIPVGFIPDVFSSA